MSILENVHGHQDLVELNREQRLQLCEEIRAFLVSNISKTGGHLASNLGVVELSVALETVFNTENDRLVFDVGHQSYVHKMLTGRQADFNTLRQFGGMAGFPKPSESHTDAFVAGHASSSVSIALGMARARTIQKQDYQVIALIGDGAATGGMAFEGLSDASVSNEPLVVVLNDNEMSIDHNVGGMAFHLRKLRAKPRYITMKRRYKRVLDRIPGGKALYRISSRIKNRIRQMLIPANIFESMGFTYLGPVDGHDTEQLIELFHNAKSMQEPVLIHVVTQKGRGFKPAEDNPKKFHGVGAFDAQTGETPTSDKPTFSQTFGDEMIRLAEENSKVCAITAAMPAGTGLLDFMNRFPQRTFDVGIAEEHAVSMAGGLAKQGMIPVVALYSTFLQRSYDMILQDICMLHLHVVIAVDRAGLVGEDGETHHGVFDVGFLRHAPGLRILCPGSCEELSKMLRWSVLYYDGPVAVRYPRGGDGAYQGSAWLMDGSSAVGKHRSGDDVTLITYGSTVNYVMDAAEQLEEKGVRASVLRLMSVKPLPVDELMESVKEGTPICVVEEVCEGCGIKEALAWELQKRGFKSKIYGIDLGGDYITHGSLQSLRKACKIDAQSIVNYVMEERSCEN